AARPRRRPRRGGRGSARAVARPSVRPRRAASGSAGGRGRRSSGPSPCQRFAPGISALPEELVPGPPWIHTPLFRVEASTGGRSQRHGGLEFLPENMREQVRECYLTGELTGFGVKKWAWENGARSDGKIPSSFSRTSPCSLRGRGFGS